LELPFLIMLAEWLSTAGLILLEQKNKNALLIFLYF